MMRHSARWLSCALLALLLIGCATTPDAPSHGREGMDRVSPVRAAEVNTRLGVGYLERGQLQLAIEKLDTALRHDPQHTPAHLTLALIYEQLGDSRRAGQHYRQASRLAPNDGATQNAFAVHLCRQQQFREAERHFERAMNDPFYNTPELAYANAGACARRAGDAAQAEQHLRRALEIDPEFGDALYQLAELYFEKDEPFRARAFLQRYEGVSGLNAAALKLGYQIENGLNNRAQAHQYANRLEQDFPDSLQARELRSQRQEDE